MFEKESGDMFEKFSQGGASANAYTSFDHTCYYFTCSSNFKSNFETLLEMMTTPYYTDATVEKEKGIIAEEIKMYDDDTNWILYYEVLKNLYEYHPLSIDIGGTVDSINTITKEDLYLCYNTFYHPRNLLVTVVGNFEVDEAESLISSYYSEMSNDDIVYNISTEDVDVYKKESKTTMDVNLSKCAIGYKQNDVLFYDPIRDAALNIYMKLLFGKTSPNYEKLSEKGIYPSVSYSELDTTGFAMISSDVNDEQEFFTLIDDIINSEVSSEMFDKYKKKLVGSNIRTFNSIDSVFRVVVDCFVNDYELEDMLEGVENLTFEQMLDYAKELFKEENKTIATIASK